MSACAPRVLIMGCGGSKGGSDAPGTISSPTFVTGLPNGELCIACKQTLNVITSGGEPVRQIPKLDAPRGIVATGDALFVCELNTHCVRKLKLGDGSQLASFGSKGAGDGELQFPGYTHAHTQTHTRARRHARARTQTHTHRPEPALCHIARLRIHSAPRPSPRLTWRQGAGVHGRHALRG